MSIYDFSEELGGGKRRRLLMDEDFSWSEVPRKRAVATVVKEPHPFDQPVDVLEGYYDERDDDGDHYARAQAVHADGDFDARDLRYDPYEVDAYEYEDEYDESPVADARSTALALPADGRRTIVITGYGSERHLVAARPRREAGLRPHERSGFKPDRIALWAFLLALALVLGATTSSHAAVLAAHIAH